MLAKLDPARVVRDLVEMVRRRRGSRGGALTEALAQ
jgi:hypothetical protein